MILSLHSDETFHPVGRRANQNPFISRNNDIADNTSWLSSIIRILLSALLWRAAMVYGVALRWMSVRTCNCGSKASNGWYRS